jgi:hypothetical protein
MSITKIINFTLFIFIIHLILININVHKLIQFKNNEFSIQDFVPNMELYTPPTMSDYIEDQPADLLKPRDELYKYIDGSNYYADDNNSANFNTDVMRVDNFYKINKDGGVKLPEDIVEPRDSKYSEFDASCPIIEQNQYTPLNDIRMGFQD